MANKKKEIIIYSKSVRDTNKLAELIANVVQAGEVICLTGDLGAGKTTFSQAFAKKLGISRPVSSPTFTIIKEYQEGRLPLYHFDLYRLGDAALDEDLGFEDYIAGDGVAVIEWAGFIEDILPDDKLEIEFKNMTTTLDSREIVIKYKDTVWGTRLNELLSSF